MRIALCLQTCDRYELTAQTLTTFAAHNDLRTFALFHGDDASSDPRVADLVAGYGFATVAKTLTRFGMIPVRRALIEAAAATGASWILLLENDIETIRPFPWDLFRAVARDRSVYCLRLYGRYKDLERRQPCLTLDKQTRRHVAWMPYRASEPAQVARIHWSAQPAVTRTPELVAHHRRAGYESDRLTVRVRRNVVSHVGLERTPERK